jgi:hypothetical protein
MQNQSIQFAPTLWASLPDISDVIPIGDADNSCLDEIRDVLIRHNAVGRFGIHLVHKHFDVNEDEVLVEYTDINSRELHCKVEKRLTKQDGNRIETMWSFIGDKATRVCDQQCVYNYGHTSRHYYRY